MNKVKYALLIYESDKYPLKGIDGECHGFISELVLPGFKGLKAYKIVVSKKQKKWPHEVVTFKRTLLHELVHFIDFIYGRDSSHTKRFYRIVDMLVKEYRV